MARQSAINFGSLSSSRGHRSSARSVFHDPVVVQMTIRNNGAFNGYRREDVYPCKWLVSPKPVVLK